MMLRFWAQSGVGMASSLRKAMFGAAIVLVFSQPLAAFDLRFETPGAPEELRESLRSAALTPGATKKAEASTQEILTAARADYARLLAVLYDAGYYGGRISIRLDGREASDIALLDAPTRLQKVQISVAPGPAFVFGQAQIAPLARQTVLPPEFHPGAPAQVGVI